jgi:hypothetical protein
VLDDMAPADAPDALRGAVAMVPLTSPVPLAGRPGRGRPLLALGIAAAFIVAVAAGAGLSGRLGGLVGGGPTPAPTATPAPWVIVSYEVMPGDDGTTDLAGVVAAVGRRLAGLGADYGIETRVSTNPSEFRVWLRADRADELRAALGSTGRLDFVPFGQTPFNAGEQIDLAAFPALFGNEAVSSATAGTDQTGRRTLDITFTASGRQAFAAYSSAHVGDFLGIVLDGRVVTAPAINEAITGGTLQVGLASDTTSSTVRTLIAVIDGGALPDPIRELASEAATPGMTAPPPLLTGGPIATSAPTAQPTADPSFAMPTSGASPAAVPGPWTTLAVGALPGAVAVPQAVAWAHGYLGYGGTQDPLSPTGGWASANGRTWTPWAANLFGLTDPQKDSLMGIVPCLDGVMTFEFPVPSGPTRANLSFDGRTWTTVDLAMPTRQPPPSAFAGGAGGVVAGSFSGPTVLVAPDCATWQTVTLPGPADARVTGVAAVGSGFIAVGFSSGGTADATGRLASWTADTRSTITALAWWSPDGITWNAAEVNAPKGVGFRDAPLVGSGGMVAVMSTIDATPGQDTLWASTDGRSWAQVKGPLGERAAGEGAGSLAGRFTGDGSRILAWGQRDDGSGPVEYWTSLDGTAWSKLTLSGSGAAAVTDPNGAGTFQPVLLRDGILFSRYALPAMFGTPGG